MSIDVYVNFNGNCREAVNYYSEIFGTKKPDFMTFGEAPHNPDFQLPEEARELIMHVGLEIEGTVVMFSDTFPEQPVTMGNHMSLVVSIDDVDRIETLFKRMEKDSKVEMPLQKTFWSKRYGSLVDQFGITWQFSHYDKSMEL